MTAYHSSLSLSMANKTPSSAKKHHKSTEPESCQTAKISFLLLPSYRLVQNCVNLSQWFSHKTATFCMEQCMSPLLFLNFEVTRHLKLLTQEL